MEILEGRIDEIIFRNERNGWTVCILEREADEVTLVGSMPFILEGEHIRAEGSWTVHPEYGRQLKVENYEKVLPREEEAIERYLACGLFKGVGQATAARIVRAFGGKTFDILLEDPGRLSELKGIPLDKALGIGKCFAEQQEMGKIILFFQQYDIGTAYAARIYKALGRDTLDRIMADPYQLLDFDLSFRVVDKIGMETGSDPGRESRILGAYRYVLMKAASEGHVYVPRLQLSSYTADMLVLDLEQVDGALSGFLAAGKLRQDTSPGTESGIYLNAYHLAECYTARKLQALASLRFQTDEHVIERCIARVEAEEGLTLAREQAEAIRQAMAQGVMIITGGPGTGKTTIIKAILTLLNQDLVRVALAAPTGRAAKRMSETTGREAKTLHRLLETSFSRDGEEPVFLRDENNPLDVEAIILDEMSMVDILMMSALLKAIRPGTRLILVGDADQLPSVGPGSVLKDIIRSGVLYTVKLTEIFRQARESRIIVNAHLINGGVAPDLCLQEGDFLHLPRSSPAEITQTICRIVQKDIPEYYGYDPIKQIQVLSPYKKGETGVWQLNTALQQVLNPKAVGKGERSSHGFVFRTGDRVMQAKNNYDLPWLKPARNGTPEENGLGIFNGDLGIITGMDLEEKKMMVLFDGDREVDYDFDILEELMPAYAITVHKSQGSEFPVVVLPLYPGPSVLMARNLLYTAVTRAQKLVVTVGREEVLIAMIRNNRQSRRFSALEERLREGIE